MKPFATQEFEGRLSRIHAAMEAKGFDVLLCASPANMLYATGYDAWSFYTPQTVIISPRLAEPIWIGRDMDRIAAEATVFMSPAALIPYAESELDTPDRLETKRVADVLAQHKLDKGTIALEMDDYYFSAAIFQALERYLPNARLLDSGRLVNWVRTVKSDAEIAAMREAGQASIRAVEAGLKAIRPGVRQCDAVAEMAREMIRGTPNAGGGWTAAPIFLAAGADGAIHMPFSDRPFEPDSSVSFELGASRHWYHSPMNRTIHLGRASAQQERLAAAVIGAMEQALHVIKAGVVAESVEERWRTEITKAGYEKGVRIGYSVGLGYPPNWGELTYSIRKGDRTVLQPNMTFHFNLGMWAKNLNFSISETIRVTSGGCESLTPFTRKLFTTDA
ncbi:MAG: Xaa-Pro peptidase family protein [Alphaproteobacteria bacterium]